MTTRSRSSPYNLKTSYGYVGFIAGPPEARDMLKNLEARCSTMQGMQGMGGMHGMGKK